MTSPHPPVLGLLLKGYPRISETFISNEILLLEQLGFKLHIISLRHPREPFSHGNIRQIKARVDYLPQSILPHLGSLVYHNLTLAMTRPRAYGKAAKRAFIRWMRSRKSATLKHLLQAGYLVHHLVPDSGIVHFHAHFAHSPTSVALFAGIMAEMDFSFFAHAKDIYTQNPCQLREKMEMATFVVTCTRYNQRFLRILGGKTTTPVFCVYHGINLNFFAGAAPPRLARPPYRILTVARHTPKKGLDLVIRAMAMLREKGIRFSHTIIGDGDERDQLQGLIRKLDMEDCISLAGTLPHEAVLNYYRTADLFVLGCRIAANHDRDGIPNVLAESMAMGVPVIAPRVSGIPELLIHGVTGLLVPPEDPRAIARAAEQLLGDSDLVRQLTRAARKKVETEFDNQRLIHDLAACYAKGMPALGKGQLPLLSTKRCRCGAGKRLTPLIGTNPEPIIVRLNAPNLNPDKTDLKNAGSRP